MQKLMIGAMTACVLILLLWVWRGSDCANPRTVSGIVQAKYVKRYGTKGADRYMVEIRTGKGVEIVQCRDSIWRLDWGAADTFAALREGETVTVRVAGWRVPFLSWFARIEG